MHGNPAAEESALCFPQYVRNRVTASRTETTPIRSLPREAHYQRGRRSYLLICHKIQNTVQVIKDLRAKVVRIL